MSNSNPAPATQADINRLETRFDELTTLVQSLATDVGVLTKAVGNVFDNNRHWHEVQLAESRRVAWQKN